MIAAVIDIGSNSVLLLTVALEADGRARGIDQALATTRLAAVDLGLATYDPRRVHGHVLDGSALARLAADIAAMPIEERRGIPGLDPGRAAILPAGAVVLARIVAAVVANGVTVSDHGVRHGYLCAALAAEGVRADLSELWP